MLEAVREALEAAHRSRVGQRSGWLNAGLAEATEVWPPEPEPEASWPAWAGYALSPRSTRGATRA